MKLRHLLLPVMFMLSVKASAQRFQGGILVGMNASQIDGDTWVGFFKGGILAGAFVNTDLQDKFGAQLEIKYSPKGSAPGSKHPNYPAKIRLNYIDVPIMGTYEAAKNLKLEGGLSFNYLYKAQYFDGAWFEWDEGEGPNSFETAILFGINYRFFQRFDLNLRWNYSLFPVRATYSGSPYSEGAWYNQVINFGLYFHIGPNS